MRRKELLPVRDRDSRSSRLLRRSVRDGLVALTLASIGSSALASPAWAAPVTQAAPVTPNASAAPSTPVTPIPKAAIAISNLIIRLDGRDEIGLATGDFRIHLIERLREKGFTAVGAENLVFDKDESRHAAFRLGGIVRELDCKVESAKTSCRIGVEWQLLSVKSDAIVYSALTRFILMDVPKADTTRLASKLLQGTLDSLLGRNRFREALADHAVKVDSVSAYPAATFAACPASAKPMPAASEDVLQSTVVVRSQSGFGSGFFISADGLVITAAHVIESSSVTLRLRDGTEVDAVPIRIARQADVALLRTTKPIDGRRCLAPSPKPSPSIGEEIYAVGAPGKLDLAFTLTRGIMSGVREHDGRRYYQTDAPVSPGNSGGPLIDGSASVIGVTSFKLAGEAIEGIAFGVPIDAALAALSLTPSGATDGSLRSAPAVDLATAPVSVLFTDTPDPQLSLDPEADRLAALRAERNARDEARDKATPGYFSVLKWGGLAATVLGGAGAFATFKQYSAWMSTHPEYRKLAVENTICWGVMIAGVGAFSYSLIMRPSASSIPNAPPRAALSVGLGNVRFEGTF